MVEKTYGWDQLFANLRAKGAGKGHFVKQLFTQPAYIIIIAGNLLVFFIPGINLSENAYSFVWIYIVQSLMIGLVHMLKLFFYKFGPPTRPEDWSNPRALGVFFLFHYGFFHFVYAFFMPPKKADWSVVLEGAAIFAVLLIANTIRHYSRENNGKYNANDFMFLPYLRVIPIHIAIIIGSFVSGITGSYLGVFVVLAICKTVLELFMEYIQSLGVSFADLQDEKTIN
ncbi:MAG: hypothetical protein JNL57_04320 [Bacteroidetes bacterium]|nr:hypothetical protein [Bacteroidota bacterium]